jgi:hypothetical protein
VDPAIFSSPAHVKWYMEVIGQGFSLPLEDMAITNDDITIYSQWLLDPKTRPAAVVNQDLEQEFFQIIFHQYSLLFQPRIFRSSNVQSIPRYQQHSSNNVYDKEDDQHNDNSNNNPSNTCTTTPQQHLDDSTTTTSELHLTTLPVHAHYNMMPFTLPPHQQRPSQPTTSSSNNSSSNTPPSQPHTPQQQHTSATNTVKDTLAPLVQRHIDLCKKALLVICSASRNIDLSPDTWIVLLKVILGITDSLLKEPSGETPIPGVKNISDELCEPLLRVSCLKSSVIDLTIKPPFFILGPL